MVAGNKILEYSYYPGLDNPHGVIDGDGEPYFAHRDGLGNVIALTDRDEDLVKEYSSYGLWGGPTSAISLASCGEYGCNRAMYKGALLAGEEAAIYHMRNRWFEPHTGRFLSEDPIGLMAGATTPIAATDSLVTGTSGRILTRMTVENGPPDLWLKW